MAATIPGRFSFYQMAKEFGRFHSVAFGPGDTLRWSEAATACPTGCSRIATAVPALTGKRFFDIHASLMWISAHVNSPSGMPTAGN